uniref:Predicted protein n=1 Tax=Hordeum vulgare subsp. vulgare TaxID=112509 RepID=F2CYI3_HORVV|nr:predicted protein [Hordeum vulgare subsp. vulgare]
MSLFITREKLSIPIAPHNVGTRGSLFVWFFSILLKAQNLQVALAAWLDARKAADTNG